jgi:uncharacterized membrane protein YedE/YeeE
MENIVYPLLGGILIGLSSSFMLGGLGRITGISGILAATLKKPKKEEQWRYLFLIGLIGGGFLIKLVRPELFNYSLDFSLFDAVFAGLLVGFGTRLGSGCTSGHGVCGLARFSKRSIVATLVFMFFGMATVALKGVFL